MASHYNCNYNRKCNYNYHYITYYATQITPHYNYNYTTLHYTTPAYIHYTIPHYSTQHYSTLHYTTLITPHHNYNCNCTNYITLQVQSPLLCNYNYNYNCTTPHYIQQLWWGDHSNHCNHSKKHSSNHLSVDSLCHPWFTTANLSYRFPIFETSATAQGGTTGKYEQLYL